MVTSETALVVKQKGIGKGNHPNSRKNLGRFKPGESGNPHGRPPAGESFNDALRYFLEMPRLQLLDCLLGGLELPPNRDNVRHMLAFQQVVSSIWDQTSRTFTMNKLDGMPKQSVEQTINSTEKWTAVQQAVPTPLRRVK